MDAKFVRDRIAQLRTLKDVSEYRMSYDLGHSRGYINNISSGKTLPSMTEFFAICEYFHITPQEFFDESSANPELIQKTADAMKDMKMSDQLLLYNLARRLAEPE